MRTIPKAKEANFFATVHVDHEEEYIALDLPAGTRFPRRVLEYLVIHELTHCLVGLATLSDSNEELVCNRLAKAFLGRRATGPREYLYKPSEDYAELEEGLKGYSRGINLVEELPEVERYVLSRIFWGHASLKDVAGELGTSKRQVGRIRNRALKMLGELVADEWAARVE